MRLYITDISDITEDMFNTGKMLVPEYRQEKIDRYQYMEDKRRSLVAGLLLNYATKDYEGKPRKSNPSKASTKTTTWNAA